MKRVWNQEKDNYLIEIHKGKSNKEITDLINNKFKTNFTIKAINSRKRVLNLISNYKYAPKYSKEIIEYIKKNHKGKSTIEISNEVNELFEIDTNPDSIQNLKSRIKRTEGFIFEPARNDGCIKKGNIPINKGTKGMFNVGGNKTSFKKGNVPPNRVPIGTEKWKKYGSSSNDKYLFVKIQDGHLNKNWKAKHILIYEQHYGPVPKGNKIIFADGDRTNFDIDNLVMVSYSEQLIMNQQGLFLKNKELTKTGVAIAKVIDKTNKLRKK